MKRSPLVRKAPLVSVKPLQRGIAPLRRVAIGPVSKKRQRENGQRRIVEAQLGREGTHGWCARCCRWTYVNGHELRRRSQGGDCARPDALLCVRCNQWAAQEPKLAAWDGWLITPKWPHDHTLENGEARDTEGRIVVIVAPQEAEQ